MVEELKEVEKQLKKKQDQVNKEALEKRAKFLRRRTKYLFTFVNASSVAYHLQWFRAFMVEKGIQKANDFIIKDIRSIVLKHVRDKHGFEKAVKMAQHSSSSTTLEYYLRYREDRRVVPELNIVDTKFVEIQNDTEEADEEEVANNS